MHCHPARGAHSDRSHLPLIRPDPRERVLAPCGDAEIGEYQDQYLFDAMDVSADFGAITEMADRIPDELAGTVIGDVTAAIDVMNLATSRDHALRGDEQVRTRGEASDRVDVGMLEEEQVVVFGPAGDRPSWMARCKSHASS